jgi:hypothetical protein
MTLTIYTSSLSLQVAEFGFALVNLFINAVKQVRVVTAELDIKLLSHYGQKTQSDFS